MRAREVASRSLCELHAFSFSTCCTHLFNCGRSLVNLPVSQRCTLLSSSGLITFPRARRMPVTSRIVINDDALVDQRLGQDKCLGIRTGYPGTVLRESIFLIGGDAVLKLCCRMTFLQTHRLQLLYSKLFGRGGHLQEWGAAADFAMAGSNTIADHRSCFGVVGWSHIF